MKKSSLLLVLLFAVLTVSAQQVAVTGISGKITGQIIDSLTKNVIEYATVTLKKPGATKGVNGGLTDTKGNFKIDNVPAGSYEMYVSFMGYSTRKISVKLSGARPDMSLGRIILIPSANMLSAVSVTGTPPLVENRVDKTVYNAEQDATVMGGNASDVLRKVPMVAVDQDGNISLRGNQNVRILINGKPTGAVSANIAEAMKMLPADQIKNVEVITSPSAKYDAEGSGGIINIVTKKKQMSGVSGSVSGGVGTRQNNGNGNININKNRLAVTVNFGGHGGWPQTTNNYFRSYNPVTQTEQIQQGNSRATRYGGMGSANVSYDFNDYNAVSTSIRLNKGLFKTDGESRNTSIIPGQATAEYGLKNYNRTSFGGFDWNADYTHKFKKQGHEITLAGQWSHSKNETDLQTEYSIPSMTNILGNNNAKNDEYTAQLDYSLPLSAAWKLEAGAKAIFRDINSPSDFYTSTNGAEFSYNTLMSNVYDYHQDVYAGYGVLSWQINKTLGMQFGGRYERTNINGSAQNQSSGIAPVDNSYDNFIPSFSVSKNLSQTSSLRLSYSKRIQRPSLQVLNPFRDVSNDQFQRQGNPLLSPEVSQTVELNYSKMFSPGSMINTSVYYRHTADIIESFATPDIYDGKPVTLTTFSNTGSNNSIGASIYGSVTMFKILTMRGNFDTYTYRPNVTGSLADVAAESKTYLMYKGFISGSVTLPGNFVTETFMILNSPRRTFQGKNPAFNMWVISFNKKFLKDKAKIGINIVDPFNERKNFNSSINTGSLVQQSNVSIPFRSFGLNFSYSFGKVNFNKAPKKKRGINNDDLKSGDENGQGMGSGN